MIDWLAICIPVYPPHFQFAYRFLEKTNNLFHVYFVFSSQEEYELFEQKDRIHPLIYPEMVTLDPDSIINKKKLFALHSLQDSPYSYILVIDAETEFLFHNFEESKFRSSIESFFQQRRIYGKQITQNKRYRSILEIMKTCAEALPLDCWMRVFEETNEFSVYTWWSDLPLYKREHLPHFFSVLAAKSISWYHFDHILYSYYLLAYHSFSIEDLTSTMENTTTLFEDYIPKEESTLLTLHTLGVPYLYIHASLFERFPTFFESIGTVFLYHMNRPIKS